LTDLSMRARLACLAVLILGLTLIGAALQGMRGVDTTLKAAVTQPSPELVREQTWQPPPHRCHGSHGSHGEV
jgi:hypothetical protein